MGADNIEMDDQHQMSLAAATELVYSSGSLFHNLQRLCVLFLFVADGLEIMILAFLQIELQNDWNLSTLEMSWLTSSVFIGMMCGALTWGYLADYYGRRPCVIAISFIISVAGVGSSFVNSLPTMCLARGMVGFGAGGSTVPHDLFVEILPKAVRTKEVYCLQYCWPIGLSPINSFIIIMIILIFYMHSL